jgi:hypothetical protein
MQFSQKFGLKKKIVKKKWIFLVFSTGGTLTKIFKSFSKVLLGVAKLD